MSIPFCAKYESKGKWQVLNKKVDKDQNKIDCMSLETKGIKSLQNLKIFHFSNEWKSRKDQDDIFDKIVFFSFSSRLSEVFILFYFFAETGSDILNHFQELNKNLKNTFFLPT